MNTVELKRTTTDNAQLADIVEEIAAKLQAGETCDITQYATRYPEYADRLRDWFQVMHAMADLGHSLTGAPVGEFLRNSQSDPAHNARPVAGILGDFHILRELGRGGMGVVYEAEQISLGRRVALKVLPFAAMLDKQQLARFKNEARAAATLDHPNIVAIYSVGAERGVHYYAMQLIEGRSLAEIIASLKPGRAPSTEDATAPFSKPLTAGDTVQAALPTVKAGGSAAFSSIPAFESRDYFKAVARLGIQAAEALDHAHQNGILHRDIKPANLMVDDDGKLWVTDFGLARIEQDAGLTMTGDLLGTLRYMSPEQALAKRVVVDHRSDIYSLGATLYELLALRPAFAGDDRQELLRQIAFDEPRRPRDFNPRIPIDLETIICKSIEKNPADRYATAQDLVEDLGRFVEQVPIKARRPSWMDRGRKWVARHAAMTAMACGCFALIAATACIGAFFIRHAYKAEFEQRTAAEANLGVAARVIEGQLSRAAVAHYSQGDLEQAEALATQATEFYEDLLKTNDNPRLRFAAARAYHDVAKIWSRVDQWEKYGDAARRSLELLKSIPNDFPSKKQFLTARGHAYEQTGVAYERDGQNQNAEEAYQQSVRDFETLAEEDPDDSWHEKNRAQSIGYLATLYQGQGRLKESEECFDRAIAIHEALPEQFCEETPLAWCAHAGLLNNRALLADRSGNLDLVVVLLERAIELQHRTLQKLRGHPMALEFLHKHLSLLATTHRRRGDHAAAAETMEALVEEFPHHLSAYHSAVSTLFLCIRTAETNARNPEFEGTDEQRREELRAVEMYHERVDRYMERARDAYVQTPDSRYDFSFLLVMHFDPSWRDAEWAMKLLDGLDAEFPNRPDVFMALALANYRLGNLESAEQASLTAGRLSGDGNGKTYDLLLRAMIRWKQGRKEDARELYDRAREAMKVRSSFNVEMVAAEAANLITKKSWKRTCRIRIPNSY